MTGEAVVEGSTSCFNKMACSPVIESIYEHEMATGVIIECKWHPGKLQVGITAPLFMIGRGILLLSAHVNMLIMSR